MTQVFDGVCGLVIAAAATDPPGVGELAVATVFRSTISGSYTGTCDLALVTLSGAQHLLLSSSVVVAQRPDVSYTFAAMHVLAPDRACDTTSAGGAGVFDSNHVITP